MNKFGYAIIKKRVIDLNDKDMYLISKLAQAEPSHKLCINCGSCTGTCSVNHYDTFNFRKILLLINRGEVDQTKNNIQKCMLCGKCMVVCPRGINIRNILLTLFHNQLD